MSLLKAQVRVSVTHDIGADLDDQLEQARREVFQQEGAKAAYATAQKLIEQLLPHLQKDIEAGKYSLEQGAEIAKWIQRATGVCESLGVQATHLVIAKSGAVAQNERLIQLVKKRLDTEQLQLAEAAKALQVEVDPTAPSAPKSIKQIRLEEAAREAEQAAKNGAQDKEAQSASPPPPALEPEPAPSLQKSSNGKMRGKGGRGVANA